jgi:ATP-dependent DNA helicase RecG
MAAPQIQPTQTPLAQPVTALWGVGAERAAQLARLDIHTVEDLLLHRPLRYEDRRRFRAIAKLTTDEPALTRGTVVAMGLKCFRKGAKSVFELILDDGTARLHCRWWNLPFMEKYFEVGNEVVAFGKLVGLKPRTMDHAETEVVEGGEERFIHFDRITPIYPLTEGVPQRWLRGLIWRTLERYEGQIAEPMFGVPPSGGLSSAVQLQGQRQQPKPPEGGTTNLATRANAVRMLHFPETLADVESARRRLALDEFVELQLQMQERRKRFQTNAAALPCGGDQNRLIKPFLAGLGFQLSAAQTKVLREIRADMAGAHPMRRLLQGDVGSGKTVVAACTALMAIESGFSVALMAPTEILAEQHHRNFAGWFESLGVGVELQTGSRKTAGGEWRVTSDMKEPQASPVTRHPSPVTLTIGTHALLTESFELPKLGLVIIDEQHKFGVTQREQLVRKGRYPHVLVMTATPIPRTLGLTLYGDLEVSVIDELPAGRGRIKTFVRGADKLPKVWEFVRQQLAAGRQAYVVYPRVEETDGGSVKAVLKEFENVKRQLAPFRVGLLHGRLAAREKDAVMTAFRGKAVNVLLATSLIEVGLDVPNATVLVVENAEQFGLSQLHQLRGRIGRGAADAYCIFVAAAETPEARQRLRVLEETNDGFRIAEADLKLRGPGELLGRQQSGVPRFRFGDLAGDSDLICLARDVAARSLQ